jgi:hypothetical protein
MIINSSYTPNKTALAIALTTILGSLSPSADAIPVLNATADYEVGIGPESDSDGPSAISVDILDNDIGPMGDVFYHTYGNASGNFGARVSGTDFFEITSTFSFADTYTNLTGVSQDYFFDFSIIPGEISTSEVLLSTLGSLFASYEIDVNLTTTIGTTSIFDSAASITTDFLTGSNFTETGTSLDGTLFNNSYLWDQFSASIGLGSFNAGEEFSINYTLTTNASSNILPGSGICGFDGGEGGLDIALVDDGFRGGCMASARSGDPFGLNGGNTFITSSQPTSTTDVPEPAVLLLMVAGLLGVMGTRRKIKNKF